MATRGEFPALYQPTKTLFILIRYACAPFNCFALVRAKLAIIASTVYSSPPPPAPPLNPLPFRFYIFIYFSKTRTLILFDPVKNCFSIIIKWIHDIFSPHNWTFKINKFGSILYKIIVLLNNLKGVCVFRCPFWTDYLISESINCIID